MVNSSLAYLVTVIKILFKIWFCEFQSAATAATTTME